MSVRPLFGGNKETFITGQARNSLNIDLGRGTLGIRNAFYSVDRGIPLDAFALRNFLYFHLL